MEKVLITGSNGFIGERLSCLFEKKYNVSKWNRKIIDLLDTKRVSEELKKGKYKVVIHCANYDAAPKFSKNDKNLVYAKNMAMFENLVLNSDYFEKMFYFGSGSEHGSLRNQYVESKREMSRRTTKELNNVFNLRLFSVYGQTADWRYRVVNNMCSKCSTCKPIMIPENKACDFLHVDDLFRIIDILINKNLEYKEYDICSGEVVSYEDVAKIIYNLTGKVFYYCDRYNKEKRQFYFGSNKGLLKEIGEDFRFVPLEHGIINLIEYYKTIEFNQYQYEY